VITFELFIQCNQLFRVNIQLNNLKEKKGLKFKLNFKFLHPSRLFKLKIYSIWKRLFFKKLLFHLCNALSSCTKYIKWFKNNKNHNLLSCHVTEEKEEKILFCLFICIFNKIAIEKSCSLNIEFNETYFCFFFDYIKCQASISSLLKDLISREVARCIPRMSDFSFSPFFILSGIYNLFFFLKYFAII
jgi:hypothetical protein